MENELMEKLKSEMKDLSEDIKWFEEFLERPLTDKELYILCTKGFDVLYHNIFDSVEAANLYKNLLELVKNKVTVSYRGEVYNNIKEESDIFHQENEDSEYEDDAPDQFYYSGRYSGDLNYKKQEQYIGDLIAAINSVTPELEADEKVKLAYEKFVKKEDKPAPADTALDDVEQDSADSFCEDKDPDDLSTLGILDNLPENSRKWMDRLTAVDIMTVINNITDMEEKGEFENKDEFFSELVDQIKNMAIARYTLDIVAGRISTIEDEEIRSEVVDYMKRKKIEIPESLCPAEHPTICLSEVDKIIDRLDKGCEIELEDEVLNAVVDKLWKERDNVSIKIRNNCISLR